jgi:hypothetical protein
MPTSPDAAVPHWTNTEKEARIEKLRSSKPVEITGEEIPYSENLKEYRRKAYKYGLSLRGEYTNKDRNIKILVSRNSINETLSHSIADSWHIPSIAAIPQIIENSIYIATMENEDKAKHHDIIHYDYYVCGLKIGNVDYTVKAVMAYSNKNESYYDHKLTKIEKGNLLDLIQKQQTPLKELLSTKPVIRKSGEESNLLSEHKDKRLFSIFQTKLVKNSVEESEVKV